MELTFNIQVLRPCCKVNIQQLEPPDTLVILLPASVCRLSHGCREAGAAGGQCGQRHCLPKAGAPGHADRSAAGDHTPEEALSW